MRITILADNYVDRMGLLAEHGFSCLVETGGRRILFDTGQGRALLNNMKELAIPQEIDMIVLSHGHYDHTGGISAHPEELSGYSANIFASEHIFDSHLKKDDGAFSEIGFGAARSDVEQIYALHLNSGLAEIADNIFLSGSVERFEDFDADRMLFGGDRKKDMFTDEQYMAVRENGGLHIITGCTHCGALNLIKDVLAKFPDEKIISLTGGLHLFRSTQEQTKKVVDFIRNQNIRMVNTGHCTGLDASMQMKEVLGSGMNITKAGLVLEL